MGNTTTEQSKWRIWYCAATTQEHFTLWCRLLLFYLHKCLTLRLALPTVHLLFLSTCALYRCYTRLLPFRRCTWETGPPTAGVPWIVLQYNGLCCRYCTVLYCTVKVHCTVQVHYNVMCRGEGHVNLTVRQEGVRAKMAHESKYHNAVTSHLTPSHSLFPPVPS
jgi:hypothetical protein